MFILMPGITLINMETLVNMSTLGFSCCGFPVPILLSLTLGVIQHVYITEFCQLNDAYVHFFHSLHCI